MRLPPNRDIEPWIISPAEISSWLLAIGQPRLCSLHGVTKQVGSSLNDVEMKLLARDLSIDAILEECPLAQA